MADELWKRSALELADLIARLSRILDDLKAGRTPKAAAVAYIGVNLAEAPGGLSVTKVQKGSPGDLAGLKEGDVITMVDGTKVSTHASEQPTSFRSSPWKARPWPMPLPLRIRPER